MGITIAAIVIAFALSKSKEPQEKSAVVERPSQPGEALPVLFQVPDFTLTNQQGKEISAADLRGQVWLADIIFTSCAGPCPDMTRRIADLQSAIPSNAPVKFVTLTTDPGTDTPSVLAAYGRRFQADPQRWHFLTGSKKQIGDLAIRGLKLTSLEKEPEKQENPNDLFVHSTMFVLVDGQGRARAVFESEDPEMRGKVLQALAKLGVNLAVEK